MGYLFQILVYICVEITQYFYQH